MKFISKEDLAEIALEYGHDLLYIVDPTDGTTRVVSIAQLVHQAALAQQWWEIVKNADTHANPEE